MAARLVTVSEPPAPPELGFGVAELDLTTLPDLTLSCGTVDFGARCVRWGDEERTLTPTETRLLAYLAGAEGRVVSQRELLKEVWGYRGGVVSRTVKTTMGRLRGKVERDPSDPDHLLTVVGAGYRFRAADPRPEEATVDEPLRRPPTRADLPRPAGAWVGPEELPEAVLDALADRRVGLVGPAGVGKTRLAIEAGLAAADAGRFDAIHFASVEAAEDGAGVARRVALALGIDPDTANTGGETVGRALASRGSVLLIVDDLDGAPGAGALLDRWLDVSPDLRLITTSRAPLGGAGRVVAVEPMTPEAAGRLFRDRAGHDAHPGYGDAARLAPVLQPLDGLPLAIEMAAGWSSFLAPEGLRTRLDRQLDLLRSDRPGRHSSLHAAFASSWDMLDPAERDALLQAAVFAGTFTLEAAEWVVRCDGADTLSLLRRLQERSLVQLVERGDAGSPGLRLLHAVRELARRQGPRLDAEGRHAAWFARLGSEAAVRALDDQGGLRAIEEVEGAREDLVIAVDRAPGQGLAEPAAGCARALLALARFKGPVLGAEQTAERVLAMPGLPPRTRARLLYDRARALMAAGRAQEAEERLKEAEATDADPEFVAECMRERASATARRDMTAALSLAADAVEAAKRTHDPKILGRALCTQGILLRPAGRGREAKSVLESSVELLRAVGDARTECAALEHLGRFALDRGRTNKARSLFESSLELARSIGARSVEAELLDRLATLSALSGSDAASEEFARALALRRVLGHRAGEGYTLVNLGAFEVERRPNAARRPLESALGIALEMADRRLEVSARANLGELYLRLGRLDYADRQLRLAIDGAKALGQPRLEAFSEGVLAQVEYARGDADGGRARMDAALAALESMELRTDLVRLTERAAACELDAGRPRLAEAHLARATRAAELSRADRPATLVH